MHDMVSCGLHHGADENFEGARELRELSAHKQIIEVNCAEMWAMSLAQKGGEVVAGIAAVGITAQCHLGD